MRIRSRVVDQNQVPPQWHRRFYLYRREDITGISGTGVVAEGIRFVDGTVALRWRTDKASTVVWASIEDALAIHGHGGATSVIWIDE